MAASAVALRLLRCRPAAPPSPMLRHLFPASYSNSKAATAAASLPAVCRAPLLPSLVRHYCRKVTPKGEQHCCNTVPNTNSDGIIVSNAKSDSTESLLDNLKDMRNNKKSLQDRDKNIQKHIEMLNKVLHDCRNISALILKRVNDLRELAAMIEKARDDWQNLRSILQVRTLEKEVEDYCNAVRRHQDFERFVRKKIAKVCAAVGLGAGLLLILVKF